MSGRNLQREIPAIFATVMTRPAGTSFHFETAPLAIPSSRMIRAWGHP